MIISDILIEDKIKEKILHKHNVRASDIKEVLFSNPYVLKTKENRYMVLGKDNRYLTIIFEMKKTVALIITAYPSSDAQRKLYKVKRE